ncbi:autophagy-related protein 18f-like isoform X1 [Rhizophagus clarus]|uniref:Autophagy-related protein 18f-like isoform X1 n=1 Tax=Rhizophagus clarus TaxID=94130 RepID=A0A8H3LDH3_9GLOM|nr:autophagy-related protein 18f-like isoform X1 [Rhizophagus clarus]
MSSVTQPATIGVKADPKFLRDPSALESISSALYGLSSYVAHTLPTSITSLRKSSSTPDHNAYQHTINHHEIDSQNHPMPPDGLFEKKKDVIIYAAFDEIVSASSSKPNTSVSQSVLMLGYPDGFQIWNVTSVDNIHELISIRDEEKLGEVTYIKSIPNPRYTSKHARDMFADIRPLVGLICISTPEREDQVPSSKPKSVLNFFSLKTHQIVKTLDFENEGNIVSVKCNERAIVISLNNPAKLHIISPLTLAPLFQPILQDIALHPSTRAPIFTLGSRLLAYATTNQPSEPGGKKDSDLGDSDELVGGSSGRYHVVAKEVAKEVVNGVKFLGDFGYQTLSAYFANSSNSQAIPQIKQSSSLPINIQNHSRGMSPVSRGSFSPSPSPSNGYYYNSRTGSVGGSSDSGNGFIATANSGMETEDSGAIGAVIIRDLGAPYSSSKKEPSVIAHFAPHTHYVGQLSFNPSGTLLFSTSVQGHKFHVFEILGKRRRGRTNHKVKHMYQLARGYTYASVSENGVGWSSDSRWCAVASGKGTIHLFAINPYGGQAHVPSHISGLVKNIDEPYSSITQSPVVRIKPRAPLPTDPTEAAANGFSQNNVFSINPHEYYSFPPPDSNSSFTATSPSRRPNPIHYNNINMHTHHLNGQLQPFSYNIPSNSFYLTRKPPGICIKFLPSLSNNSKTGLAAGNDGLLFANLNAKRQNKRRSSPSVNHEGNTSANSGNKSGRRRTQSWSQNSLSTLNTNRQYLEVENLESKQEDIGYQDMLSFHPTGILTLHRVWMEGIVVGEQDSSRQGGNQESNNLITMAGTPLAGTPLAGSAAAVANVGRALVGGASTVVGGITGVTRKEAGSLDMITNYDDVAEWQLVRSNNWAEVKNVFETPKLHTESDMLVKKDSNNKWLANAEIATHTSSRTSLPPSLWANPQFTFQTFLPGHKETIRKGEIPRSKKIEIRRDVVEHVEMVDEVNGNALGVNGWANNGKNNYDISENLSTAMHTSLDFLPSSPTLSAVSTKSKDRIPNGFNGHACTIPGDISITPLSFEDAYHIQISNNNPANTPTTISSAPYTTKSKLNSTISSNVISANNNMIISHPLSFTRSTSSLSSVNTSETTFSDEVDVLTKEIEHTEDFTSEEGNFFFSPDGDNEVELPSNSIIELRNGKSIEEYVNGWV